MKVCSTARGPTQNRAGASLCLPYARKSVQLSSIAVQRLVCGWPLRARTVQHSHTWMNTYTMINMLTRGLLSSTSHFIYGLLSRLSSDSFCIFLQSISFSVCVDMYRWRGYSDAGGHMVVRRDRTRQYDMLENRRKEEVELRLRWDSLV